MSNLFTNVVPKESLRRAQLETMEALKEYLSKSFGPYGSNTIINKENQTILIHNVVGINKEDLKISIKTENGEKILYIAGQTKDKVSGSNYEINSRFKIKAQSIRNIECECANGLLYVTISYDKPEEEEIKIK